VNGLQIQDNLKRSSFRLLPEQELQYYAKQVVTTLESTLLSEWDLLGIVRDTKTPFLTAHLLLYVVHIPPDIAKRVAMHLLLRGLVVGHCFGMAPPVRRG